MLDPISLDVIDAEWQRLFAEPEASGGLSTTAVMLKLHRDPESSWERKETLADLRRRQRAGLIRRANGRFRDPLSEKMVHGHVWFLNG